MLNRPLRAAGVTIEDSLRPSRSLKFSDNSNGGDTEDEIKAGDLGAVLTCVGKNICLAVCEILSFKKGTSKTLSSIRASDLDVPESNIIIAVQILQLIMPHDKASDAAVTLDGATWTWISKYIQIQKNRKDTAVTQRHFVTHVVGKHFYPLAPDLIYDKQHKATWSISHESLCEILDEAWDALNPNSDEVLINIELLVKITGEGLPYKNASGIPQLSFPNPAAPIPQHRSLLNSANTSTANDEHSDLNLTGTSSVICPLCEREMALRAMRNHVGRHILRAQYGCQDKLSDGVKVSSKL